VVASMVSAENHFCHVKRLHLWSFWLMDHIKGVVDTELDVCGSQLFTVNICSSSSEMIIKWMNAVEGLVHEF
jgi:hypothetical protein